MKENVKSIFRGKISVPRCRVISDDPEKGLVDYCLSALVQYVCDQKGQQNTRHCQDIEGRRDMLFPFQKPMVILPLEHKGQ